MEFPKRLKILRVSKGLTQADLSNNLQCNQSLIANYETGRKKPSYEMAQKIADFFKVSVPFLMSDQPMLSDDLYADGYTDESYLDDLERREERIKEKELEQKVLTLFNQLSDDAKVVFLNALESFKKK